MKAMVLVTLVSACTALPQLFLADTPEVQAEKQRHFQLYQAAADAANAAPDINVFPQQRQQPSSSHRFNSVHHQQQQQFSHHQQSPQQFSQHRFASHQNPIPSQPKWTGPLAAEIPAGLPGSAPQVRNTPEVEAAIADFTRAYNSAVVATRSNTASQSNQFNQGRQFNQVSSFPRAQTHVAPQSQPRWTGPLAATIPAGLPGSAAQVADTADVVAAKQRFQQAFQQQLGNVHG